ncbi:MBL fold metallo-hydrolase RNA specificity domain-containing protein [Desulfurobacterium indicum]|uniref:MBL fold metallo-hydrolase n=1 Tax=Desulfurobacterium indicum TaxID=1914305 RepID=A0A1R1MNH7_9BACT|nr:MBL fold metallo-hydrolase [Desulfurobacterium indicum]OMH41327.1 MBL fold metallo-hydrolase [Desulfurobacterium indicum]
MKIMFCGAAQVVTGSCHLIETGNSKFLLDCGQFQGAMELEDLNYTFPFRPSDIDFVILSHGHLDHCGRLPLLVKEGFSGKIYATPGTIDIARLILMDAAQVQEESIETVNRKREREGLPPVAPLFILDDVFDVFDLFEPIPYGEWVGIKDLKFRFSDAGHILCSSFIEMEIEGKRVVYSGDLGNKGKPFVRDPFYPEKADVLIVESTYGNRVHKSVVESVRELKEAILDTFKRGGVVLIPTFALERAQDILYFLKQFIEKREIPKCKVFLDSPLAISITRTFKRHKECFDKDTLEMFKKGDPLNFPGLTFTRTVEESMRINQVKSHAIIIAGNGMCTAGRIVHHLRHHLWDRNSSIVFIGYQAEGTTGREIIEGKKKVKIFNEYIKVNAKVYTINGFSSHADKPQLIDWIKRGTKKDTRIVLVHGEKDVMKDYGEAILKDIGIKPIIPELYETLTF